MDDINLEKLSLEEIKELIESPLKWAEAFLIEPNTQKRFKANYVERKILSAKGPWVVVRVPRRQGKSYSLSILAIHAAVTKPNQTVLILGPTESHVTGLFDYIRNFLSVNPDIASSIIENSKSPHRIKFSNMSMITGKTTGASSNRKALSVRGQGGDLVIIDEAAYLRENDFAAIAPIFTNDVYRETVRIVAASTPTADHGRYYMWNTNPEYGFEVIHVPITEIPEISEERLAQIKAVSNEIEWIVEHLAEFPDVGDNVFRNSDIDAAKQRYSYSLDRLNHNNIYAIGVDWDKFSSGVNIVVVELCTQTGRLRLVYREETPRSKYTLTGAVQRVIALNNLIKPKYIYIDRGYGETQIELLRLYGADHPESGLTRNIRGIAFQEYVGLFDPVTGEKVKKPFKTAMISTLCRVFEERLIDISDRDSVLDKQLRDYKILSFTSDRIQTSRKNEHIIDALGLAVYALYTNHMDEVKFEPARGPVLTKAPAVVKSRRAMQAEREFFKKLRPATSPIKGWTRGTLGDRPLTRKRF